MAWVSLPKINFRAYRHERYLRAVHEVYGQGVLIHRVRYARESCPLCQPGERGGRCFSWSFERCAFYCFKCGAKGDAVELVRRLIGGKVVDAAKWLEQRGGPSGSGLVLLPDTPKRGVETIPI